MAARAPLQAGLPGEPLYGMTPEAGLPLGFTPHRTPPRPCLKNRRRA
jgi:hydroxymethylglutaryl-CoA lyase